jgi:hypothetical protein
VVELSARAMALKEWPSDDPKDPITWPDDFSDRERETYDILARAALEAARYGEMLAEITELGEVAKGCAKREAQYFADRKELLLALKRSRIALNLVPANDKRFDPANYAAIKKVTDIIDALLSSIGAA